MKKNLLLLFTAFFVSCTDLQFMSETPADTAALAAESEFTALIEQARYGNSQAFLKLADCYRDGKGVEQDFAGMLCMVSQAEDFGGIGRMEDYLKRIPEGSNFRTFVEAMDKIDDRQFEEIQSMSEQLIANGCPDGYTLQGVIAIERGDTLAGLRLLEQAASQGSSMAELMLCLPEWRGGDVPDIQRLMAMSDRNPFANIILAKIYAGEYNESLTDNRLAAYYFRKADEKAYLNKRGARWLLNCHLNDSTFSLSENDIRRLQILVGETSSQMQEEILEVADTMVIAEP